MNKITPARKKQILERLLREEKNIASSAKEKNNLPLKNNRRLSTQVLTIHPKKELLKVALVTSICLLIIFSALLIDLQTDFFAKESSRLMQILHI